MYVWQPKLRSRISRELKDLREDESGMGTIEVVLILVVLIALVIFFRKSISDLLKNIFNQINSDASDVYNATPIE